MVIIFKIILEIHQKFCPLGVHGSTYTEFKNYHIRYTLYVGLKNTVIKERFFMTLFQIHRQRTAIEKANFDF